MKASKRKELPPCPDGEGWSRTDLIAGKLLFPDPDAPEDYDRLIESLRRHLDLAVLGLGDNGHFGYNEPATPYDSRTHRQKLTDATKRQLKRGFTEEDMPE